MIQIPVSVGELIDKITILEVKIKNIKDSLKRKNCENELHFLNQIAKENCFVFDLEKNQLIKINSQLWEVEDKLRILEKNKDFGDEFVQLARSVYIINDQRAEVKKSINEKSGSEIIEEKEYVDYK